MIAGVLPVAARVLKQDEAIKELFRERIRDGCGQALFVPSMLWSAQRRSSLEVGRCA